MRRSSSSYGPADLAASLRRVVASIDPNQPVYGSTEMKALIGDSIEDKRFITMLLTATGVLALLLAAAGIYEALSYAISRRTQEIGIRMALGATTGRVERLVLREGMALAGLGMGAGLAAALALTRVLRTCLFGLGNNTAAVIGLALALVTVTALFACAARPPAARRGSIQWPR